MSWNQKSPYQVTLQQNIQLHEQQEEYNNKNFIILFHNFQFGVIHVRL